jgi:hypothetical protein
MKFIRPLTTAALLLTIAGGGLFGCFGTMKSKTHTLVCFILCAERDTEVSTEVAKRDAQIEIAKERRKAAEAEVEAEAKTGKPIQVELPPNPIPDVPEEK